MRRSQNTNKRIEEKKYSNNEFMSIKEHINEIIDLVFEVSEFGTNTFRVTSHPSWLKEGYEEESIRKIFELVGEFKGNFDRGVKNKEK